ncbi:flagellar hook-length control protein FliK [Xanthomonas maliensis]|uniref:flagellar hook-length control protein FliK n=1 Tax=Xanthomonas maliensis TaxID=1321368 RepID=UPI00039A4281|nr:flagellar hook-length control protein FliK [Xanthomonas maliensis]KAB7771890.1 flagellar hook-length control protein FliK [Xanthomonas maliensis]
MNPLSAFVTGLNALASTGKKSSYSDPAPEQDPGQDQFARMLQPGNNGNQAAPAPERASAKPAPKPAPSDKQRSDDDNGDESAGTGDAAARPRGQDSDSKPSPASKESTTKESSAAAGSDKSKPKTAASDGQDHAEDSTTPAAASWPPPGLGGFGMSLLAQAVPGGDALAAAAAALTAATASTTATTATALPAETTPTAGAGAAPSLPALGALTPAANAGAKGATPTLPTGEVQAATVMPLMTNALTASADDATAAKAPDAPAFVLPTTPTTALARPQDAAPIFTASPTPTPELGSDGFDDAIGARLSWLADQKIGHAHIKLTPNEMGPVEVRLHLEGDKVNASFTAAQADTRQALEQSLPRLRELLGQSGFQLGQADVGQQQQGQTGGRNGSEPGSGLVLEDSPPVGIPSVVLRQRGLLDAYA